MTGRTVPAETHFLKSGLPHAFTERQCLRAAEAPRRARVRERDRRLGFHATLAAPHRHSQGEQSFAPASMKRPDVTTNTITNTRISHESFFDRSRCDKDRLGVI
jgi:hypothetical protein